MKRKLSMKEEVNKDSSEVFHRTGRSLNIELNQYFEQWNAGLSFKHCFNKYWARARSVEMDSAEFAEELSKLGYVKIVRSPTGKRYVFPGDTKKSDDELQEIIQNQEFLDREAKEAK